MLVRWPLVETGTDSVGGDPFEAVRVFGDDVTELLVRLYEFEDSRVTARRTAGDQPWEVVLPRE